MPGYCHSLSFNSKWRKRGVASVKLGGGEIDIDKLARSGRIDSRVLVDQYNLLLLTPTDTLAPLSFPVQSREMSARLPACAS
jgi:hypothetical protein